MAALRTISKKAPRRLALGCSGIMLMAMLLETSPAHGASSSTPTGLMVPLFSYDGPTWAQLIGYHQQYPSVPVVAVIDPDLGPGTFPDPALATGVQSLENSGIPVLGYVVTHYAHSSIPSVEALIREYKTWYQVDGIMIDELNNSASEAGYASTLTSYDQSLGMNMTVGNPGTDVPPNFVGAVTCSVIYESPGVPTISFIAGWHAAYPKSNFVITAYAVSPLNTTWVIQASKYLGWLYITDGVFPDPYTKALPSYMDQLMSTLSSVDT